MTITVEDISPLLKSLWNVRDSIAVGLLGSPGIGKTQEIYNFANWVRENTQFKQCKVVEYILSQALPSEISGICMPDRKTEELVIYDHRKLTSLKDGDILFLDEFLEAPEQVRKACLTLIMERRLMSGKKLPDIMVVAASNPCKAGRISIAQRERFKWFEIDYKKIHWSHWIEENLGVSDAIDLAHYLESVDEMPENTTWNFKTPRSITQMVKWYQADPEGAEKFIPFIYPGLINRIKTVVNRDNDINEMIIKALEECMSSVHFNDEIFSLLQDFKSKSIDTQEVARRISELDDPDGIIEKIFSGYKLEEVEYDDCKEVINF